MHHMRIKNYIELTRKIYLFLFQKYIIHFSRLLRYKTYPYHGGSIYKIYNKETFNRCLNLKIILAHRSYLSIFSI